MSTRQVQLKLFIFFTLHFAVILACAAIFRLVRPVIGLAWAFSSYMFILLIYSYWITPAFRKYGFPKWMGIGFVIGTLVFFCLYLLVQSGFLQP